MNLISNFVSWSFAVGLLSGFLLSRVWEVMKVCRLDKRKPLPNGKPRSKWKAIQVDPRWFTGAIAVGFLCWSVYTTQANAAMNAQTASDAKAFAAETRQCQKVLIVAITGGRSVTAQYNEQSEEQRSALSTWLRTLLEPPPEIASLPGDSEARQQWAVGVTSQYFNSIQRSQVEQAATNAKRPPLPDPDCGD